MKAIEEVYPDIAKAIADDDYCWGTSDYSPMFTSFGFGILLQVDDRDYQGDSRLLFKDGDRYGYLNFGWGSCSGCDSLQACGSSLSQIDALRQSLYNGIQWFESKVEALEWFESHDWEGDYGYHRSEQEQFIEQAKSILSKDTQ